ncbi:pre-rRNA 2'-O-ribose RNA methyltransferase FTSJ3 [Ciona intestinalis]
MGKKKQVAKARKDKYYHLAKETGYRARSAFKLLQLNKKFNFLQSSQACVDLCAAPGGWLQVASEHMPMSSIIVGVDLVPIRAVPKCVTFQDDITKESCRTQLKRELHKWKVDCFLHDGAPNVGKNWLHDAYSQSVLTLAALKLASEFLGKGGWFITKVFRSKDYQALMWIFGQLFNKVHATKPQASRNVSAEIFVVCQGFKSPDKIDKKFFDPKSVFQEVEAKTRPVNILDFEPKKKKKAKGYGDEAKDLLYTKKSVSEFLGCSQPMQMLSEISEIVFEDDDQMVHPLVTDEIKEHVKDIKRLGKKEIKALLKWHKKWQKLNAPQVEEVGENEEEEVDSEEEMERKIQEIQENETRELKKKKKVVTKERQKLRERMSNMVTSTNSQEDMELFALSKINSARKMGTVMENVEEFELEEGSDEEGSESSEEEEEEEDGDNEGNPLIHSLEDKVEDDYQTKLWFGKEEFENIGDDLDELEEIESAKKIYENRVEKKKKEVEEKTEVQKKIEAYNSDSSDSDSDYDVEETLNEAKPVTATKGKKQKKQKLDAEALALGTVIATSNKRKRDVIDDSFNRYTFNDEECALPDWFLEDEKKRVVKNHLRHHVSKSMMEFYGSKDKGINVRTIKKVVEAKARKKRKATKKMEKAQKQAEGISDTADMSTKEKAAHIKNIYKKAGLLKKKKENTTYVFAKRGTGKRVRRPPGVSGKFKVVDKRMKKDLRPQGKNSKQSKGKSGGGGGKKRK